jgi:hypothetical protein
MRPLSRRAAPRGPTLTVSGLRVLCSMLNAACCSTRRHRALCLSHSHASDRCGLPLQPARSRPWHQNRVPLPHPAVGRAAATSRATAGVLGRSQASRRALTFINSCSRCGHTIIASRRRPCRGEDAAHLLQPSQGLRKQTLRFCSPPPLHNHDLHDRPCVFFASNSVQCTVQVA